MRRFFLAAILFALAGTSAAIADGQPNPGAQRQPKQKGTGFPNNQPGTQPNPWGTTPGRARASLTVLEEDLETLQAHKDVKKAYVKAAEIGVRAAELNADRIEKLVRVKAVTTEEAEKAKMDVQVAQAQLEIRNAEMKEVEVRIKYAAKRLEDAKAIRGKLGDPDKAPAPKLVDPKPPTSGGF